MNTTWQVRWLNVEGDMVHVGFYTGNPIEIARYLANRFDKHPYFCFNAVTPIRITAEEAIAETPVFENVYLEVYADEETVGIVREQYPDDANVGGARVGGYTHYNAYTFVSIHTA